MAQRAYDNPFRPGAGHMPPYLAGRKHEQQAFLRLLEQEVVLENLVLTGLRGVGKTVLLDALKPLAMKQGWMWVGTDLSETSSISENHLAVRLLADLSPVTSTVAVGKQLVMRIGFLGSTHVPKFFDYDMMSEIYQKTPGLSSDKLKAVLQTAWKVMEPLGVRGLIFAYDEAQNMQDHATKEEYPLSLLLDVFQSIQRQKIPFMLVLTGLPTLFPKLVEARTFSERMFHVIFLDRLNDQDSREAVVKPTANLPTQMTDDSVDTIVKESGGYPYFIQFFCREVYDVFLRSKGRGASVPIVDIKRKLDADFFAGRWAKASDRQRELLRVAASLPDCDKEFTIQAVSKRSHEILEKPFNTSRINQMFSQLGDAGLVYKNRHGKYAFAVPMLGEFIRRQYPELH